MSTQKNEQYHIMSPEWLKKNPLPDDAEGQSHGGNWFPSDYRGEKLPHDIFMVYRTQRTDLPPEAYITPPTDTTGSGREGETPDALEAEFQQWLEYKTDRGNPDPSPDARMVRRTPIDGLRIAWLDGKKRADAQVEALRRDGERMNWLEKNAVKELKINNDGTYVQLDRWHRKYITAHSWTEPTLRAAIDSAQRQEGRKAD